MCHLHCDVSALTQAEFSLLDFKVSEEATKMELPLYIELKGKRIDTGCGHLTVSSSDGRGVFFTT